MALKSELEELSGTARKQYLENLSLMKALTSTMKVLKDNDRYFRENDLNTKEVMKYMIDYFNHVNTLLNFKNDEADGDTAS